MRAFVLAMSIGSLLAVPRGAKEPVTFTKDVAPILEARCQGCHRKGEAAPMALTSYKESRPWAAAIREAVLLKRMPPWYADPHFGKFSNDRSLTKAEIDTLVAWADSGAAEGDASQPRKPARFVDGWNIGEPDLVLEMPEEYRVPAEGTIEYQYFTIPTKFPEDRWVRMAEVRPGNRALVHHVIAYVKPPADPQGESRTATARKRTAKNFSSATRPARFPSPCRRAARS